MGLTEASYGVLFATIAAGSLIGALLATPSSDIWAARGPCCWASSVAWASLAPRS
jgi:hypothetical protein